MEYRKCFISTCKNDSVNAPGKIFARIREDLREKWCKIAKVEYFKVYTQFCCEDHFDLMEDLQNYYRHKLTNEEPKLKSTALLRVSTASTSTDSTELCKLLRQQLMATTQTPIKRKYVEDDTLTTPSTSACSMLPIKVHVTTQCEIKMVDKSTNYKIRKLASGDADATVEVKSSQDTSSAATPSLFGCTSETEESTSYEPKKQLRGREVMLNIVFKKPKMYLGLPKQYLWLALRLLKLKQND